MKKLVQISVIITLSTTSILAIYLILLVVKVKTAVQVLVPKVDITLTSIQAIETNTTRTEAELSGLLNTTRHIAIQERAAQDKQLQDLQVLTTKAYVVLDDTDQTIKQIGALAPVMSDSIKSASDDIHVTLYSSQRLLEATTDDLSSPSIKTTMENVQTASKNTADATQNLSDTTKDIKDYVHRETAPVRGTWNFIKELINQTWAIRGALGY